MANRRKPNKVHLADGTFRKDRHGDVDANPATEDGLTIIPRPPHHFNKWSKEEWNRILKEMIDMEMAETIDLGLIEQACTYYGIFRSISVDLAKQPNLFDFFNNKNSRYLMNNLNEAYKGYSDVVYKMGVSPVERSKIQTKKKPKVEDNPFANSAFRKA